MQTIHADNSFDSTLYSVLDARCSKLSGIAYDYGCASRAEYDGLGNNHRKR